MPQEPTVTRRDFLKLTGAAAVGSIISTMGPAGVAAEPTPVPTRPFGNTGIEVPILSFGGSLHLPQLMLRQAFLWGVTYWDTASSYMGGNSETRIGKYFSAFPQDRPKIFLVTKSHAWTIAGMSADLDESLRRMNTEYVDLFFVHSVGRIEELDDAKRRWGEKKKSEGKIRLFGFSTHSNMEQCLLDASGLGWIDAIMMSYNYRLMHTDAMRRAVDACAEAGVGLTAMKTQGGGIFSQRRGSGTGNGRSVLSQRIHRRTGQTQGRMGKPPDRQYLFGDAEHEAAHGKCLGCTEPHPAFGRRPAKSAATRPVDSRELLHRMYADLRVGP